MAKRTSRNRNTWRKWWNRLPSTCANTRNSNLVKLWKLFTSYRSSKEGAAVKAYNISLESKYNAGLASYIIIRNIPSIGVLEELKEIVSQYGGLEIEFRTLDDIPAAPFTDVALVRFEDVELARYPAILKIGKQRKN